MTTQLTRKEQNANYYQKNKTHVVSVRLNQNTMTKFKELEEEKKKKKSARGGGWRQRRLKLLNQQSGRGPETVRAPSR